MTVYIGANREYRDRLFKLIFGNPENKLWALMLYNAVNGAHYTDPDSVELYTIENVVYMSMKNDVSFLIGDTLNSMSSSRRSTRICQCASWYMRV